MAVKDWSTTASLNTSVGGVSIAEGAARANMNDSQRAIMAEAKAKFDSIGVSMDDFGAVGDGTTDDYAAFNLFRTAVALTPTASVTLNLTPGKTYASRDNGWLLGLAARKVIVKANGARFKNIITAGQVGGFLDTPPLLLGGLGYVDAVTAQLTAKGYAINYANNYLINSATRGATSVTTTTAADAGNLAAGDWVLICSDLAYIGGSPPSMHFFEYAKVLTAVAGTGVVTLDGSRLRNNYSATRDNTLLSGQFGSRARIFKLHSSWNCDIEVHDLIVDPSTNYSGIAAYGFGREIKTYNCEFPGLTITNADSYLSTGDRFVQTTAFEPVDKLVRSARFIDPKFNGSNIGGDGSGGLVSIEGGRIDGKLAAWANTSLNGTELGGDTNGGVTLFRATRFSAHNCTGPAGLVSTEAAIVMTVDGATITSTATTIVVPRAGITSGSTLGQFIQALYVGCRIDEYSATTNSGYRNGKFCLVTSITDSGANLVIGVNYSGGTSITNGTIFRAPDLVAYHASGNTGAGVLANDPILQSTTGIPNGDLSAIRGNKRTLLIAPVSGDSYGTASLPVNGIPKRISARVHRVYTGGVHATLGLEILAVLPTPASLARIDLKTFGGREATRASASTALGADTWAALASTYVGRLNLVINVAAAGAAAALGTGTETLPIVEVEIEFEDIAHNVPVAA